MKFWDDMQEGVSSDDKIVMIGNPNTKMPEFIRLGDFRPEKVATKIDVSFSSIYPYKEGERGEYIPTLKNAIKAFCIYPEFYDNSKRYVIASVRRNDNNESQIGVYTVDNGVFTELDNLKFTGDPADGKIQTLIGKRSAIQIYWDALDNGFKATSMNNGYALAVDVFSETNPLYQSVKEKLYPYAVGASGTNKEILADAILELWINPKYTDDTYIYYLSSLRRNYLDASGRYTTGVGVYYRVQGDNTLRLHDSILIEGDITGEYTLENEKIAISVDWSKIPSGTLYADMASTYPLDSNVFSLNNALNRQAETINMIQDPTFKYGNLSKEVQNPLLFVNGTNTILDIEKGYAVVKNNQTGLKGFAIYAKFESNWVQRFGLKAGDKIRVGAFIKYELPTTSTLALWGFVGNMALSEDQITYTPRTVSYPNNKLPTNYVWIENDYTLRADVNINQDTYIPLGFLRVTSTSAANYDKIYIKNPCILFNPSDRDKGFFESDRLKSLTSVDAQNVHTNNMNFKGGQVDAEVFSLKTELIDTRMVEFAQNYDFPSKGTWFGLHGNDLVLCVNGEKYKITKEKI